MPGLGIAWVGVNIRGTGCSGGSAWSMREAASGIRP